MENDKANSKIQNQKDLSVTPERDVALKIASRGLEAIDSVQVIRKCVRLNNRTLLINGKPFELPVGGKLIIIAVGKCAFDSTQELEKILGDALTHGVVLDVRNRSVYQLRKVEYTVGSHPMPTNDNVISTKKIIEAITGLTENDTVLFVISGGGSTLLCLPETGTTFLDEKLIVEELFRAGAPIQELNTVRKHMSYGRGGNLAKYAYPAQVISLIFSDIPDNSIEFIASGPTVKDTTTIHDANTVLIKYEVLQRTNLERCALIETPKEDKYFERVYNTIIVSNEFALKEMEDEAKKLGLNPKISTTNLTGIARMVGERIAREISKSPPGTVFLYGGETTVIVGGNGRGGRNQELALSALVADKENKNTLILSLASDGKDNGIYAGAIVDAVTKEKAKNKNISPQNYLDNNDATTFFELTEDLIITGSTGSNVSDFTIAINKIKQ